MSVNTFSKKTADRIFLKFHIKLETLNYRNLRKPNFSERLAFWEKAQKIPQKKGFLAFSKNSIN